VEGLFNQKGFEYEFGADEFDVRLDYIEIPVLFRVQVAQAKGVYALVGPSFGFNVKAASSSEIGDIEQSVDIDDSIAGFEMSLAVAVGYQTGRFLVEGRYMEGLTNVLENATDTMNYTTRTFAVLGGFRF
jgi:metal-dependent hydrolase (beta-lactamase superfamily II)